MLVVGARLDRSEAFGSLWISPSIGMIARVGGIQSFVVATGQHIGREFMNAPPEPTDEDEEEELYTDFECAKARFRPCSRRSLFPFAFIHGCARRREPAVLRECLAIGNNGGAGLFHLLHQWESHPTTRKSIACSQACESSIQFSSHLMFFR